MRVTFQVRFNQDDSIGPYERIEEAVRAYVSAARDHADAQLHAVIDTGRRQTAFPPLEHTGIMTLVHELLKDAVP